MSDFLSPQTLADYLGVSVNTIYNWRVLKQGPPGIRVGGQIRFRRADVEEWLEEQRSA